MTPSTRRFPPALRSRNTHMGVSWRRLSPIPGRLGPGTLLDAGAAYWWPSESRGSSSSSPTRFAGQTARDDYDSAEIGPLRRAFSRSQATSRDTYGVRTAADDLAAIPVQTVATTSTTRSTSSSAIPGQSGSRTSRSLASSVTVRSPA
jgi:hypothetical protein